MKFTDKVLYTGLILSAVFMLASIVACDVLAHKSRVAVILAILAGICFAIGILVILYALWSAP